MDDTHGLINGFELRQLQKGTPPCNLGKKILPPEALTVLLADSISTCCLVLSKLQSLPILHPQMRLQGSDDTDT